MIRTVAVIDLGKTNSKVALVDTQTCTELQVLKQASALDKTAAYPSLDHRAIEAFITEALKSLGSSHPIDAITVTTHGATAALLDADGELALPVVDYEFKGVDETRDEYEALRAPFADTGSPSLPGGLNIGAQLFWQQRLFPEQFAQVKTVLTWPQYWVYWLTGEKANDVTSLGCHTDLYEPHHQSYSALVDKLQWRSLMPATQRSGQRIGSIRPDIALATNLPTTTPVFTGIHDSNASLVPHLIWQSAPFSVVSTGTWFIAMAIGGERTELDQHRDTTINVNAKGDAVPSARFMGGRERDLLNVSEPVTESDMTEFLANHSSLPLLMPSVVSGTGPYPHAIKQWIDKPNNIKAAHEHCAVTLYLALMTNECLQLIGADGPTYIEGPLAQDAQFAQMLAVATEREVFISVTETGTSVGAAMLINQAATPPNYEPVKVATEKHIKLQQYVKLWQQALDNTHQ